MLGEERSPNSRVLGISYAAQNITGLEINQAPVPQLETRNVVQGHKGELCSGKHISVTLLPFLALPL